MTHAHADHFDQPRNSPDRGAALSTSPESTSMSSSHPIRKPRGVLAVLALLAAMLPFAAIPTASAGEMKQWVCRTPDGALTGTTDGWTFDNSVPGAVVYSNCSTENGATGMRMDANNMYDAAANQAVMWWRYRTPDAVSIAQVYLFVDGITRGDASRGGTLSMTFTQGGPFYSPNSILQTCDQWQGCDRWLQWIHHVPAPDTGSWYAMWFCGGPQGGVCPGGFRGGMTLSHGFVVLRDTFDPFASNLTGAAATQATLRGSSNLAFSAGDIGVGISDVEVRIGGVAVLPRQIIDTNNNRCVPNSGGYLYSQPCKKSLQANLNIDTTKAPEGTQTLSATIWDASGNAATVLNRQVTIDNVPPPTVITRPTTNIVGSYAAVGDVATADDGRWGGAAVKLSRRWQRSSDGEAWENIESTQPTYRLDDSDLGKFIRVVVTATNAEGTTVSASERSDSRVQQQGAGIKGPPAPGAEGDLGANGSGGNLSTGRLVNSRKSRTLKVSYGRKAKITGRLVDSAGHAIAGAKLDVYETRSSKGSVRAKTGSMTTNDKGEYEYRPKTTASKKIDLAYAGTFGGAGYTDTLTVSLEVRAWVTLKTSRKSARRGSPVRLFGRVHGELPKRGVLIQLRALTGTEVIEFKNARTDSKGRFSYVRRFKNAGPFYFRAKMLAAGDVALASGESKVAKLRIR